MAAMHLKSRVRVLDAFRGVAVAAVALYHYTYRWGPHDGPDLVHSSLDVSLFSFGYLGVDLFFIISGFVIFLTLEQCRDVREFAIRRFARLYPPFVVCSLVTFAAVGAFGPPELKVGMADLLAGLTMHGTYFHRQFVDGAYWSLVYEVHFYFWIAVVYFGFRKRFVAAWLVFSFLAVAVQLMSARFGGLFLGAFVAYFNAGMGYYLRYKRHRLDRESASLLVSALIAYLLLWWGRGLFVGLAVAGMVVAFELFLAGLLDWIRYTGLAALGLISYSLYLLHQNIGVSLLAALDRTPLDGLPALLIVAVAIVCLATAMYFLVEAPSQSLGRKWVARLRAPAAAPAVEAAE